MEVRIQAIHFDANDRLVEFINKKAERLQRHIPALTSVDFKLSVVKPETVMNKEAVATALAPQEEYVVTKVANSFEEAVDLCLEAVERMAEKKKDKK